MCLIMLKSSIDILSFSIKKIPNIQRGFLALCQIQQETEIHTSSFQTAKKGLPFEYVEHVHQPFISRKWDLEELKTVDLKQPRSAFMHSEELKSDTCSEAAKKILSLEFATKSEVRDEIKWRYMTSVQKHCLDTGSYEACIAALTIKIRNLKIHVEKQPRNKESSHALKLAIDKRNKFLNVMRTHDYPRFEWLVKELNIVYQIPARFHYVPDRKKTIREMTQKHCEDIRMEKIGTIREELRAQQTDFIKEKEEKLRFIAEEEKALGISFENDGTQPLDDERLPLPPPVASSLLQIARTVEGPYVEPVFVKRRKSS